MTETEKIVDELRKVGKLRTRSRNGVDRTREAVDEVSDIKDAAEKAADAFSELEDVLSQLDDFREEVQALADKGLFMSKEQVELLTHAITDLETALPGDAEGLTELVSTFENAESAAQDAESALDTDGYGKEERDEAFFEAIGQADNLADAIDGITVTADAGGSRTERHDYEPGDGSHAMETDPLCRLLQIRGAR
jgi:chromosome segregation ATPase